MEVVAARTFINAEGGRRKHRRLIRSSSAAFFYLCLPRPLTPTAPEYLFVKRPTVRRDMPTFDGFLATWNVAWEADHLRGDLMTETDWDAVARVDSLARLLQLVDDARVPDGEPDAGRPTANLFLVPQIGRSRFAAYGRTLPLAAAPDP
jgi:hypothetical protein